MIVQLFRNTLHQGISVDNRYGLLDAFVFLKFPSSPLDYRYSTEIFLEGSLGATVKLSPCDL